MKDRYQMKEPNNFESLKIPDLFTYLTAHNFSLAQACSGARPHSQVCSVNNKYTVELECYTGISQLFKFCQKLDQI